MGSASFTRRGEEANNDELFSTLGGKEFVLNEEVKIGQLGETKDETQIGRGMGKE